MQEQTTTQSVVEQGSQPTCCQTDNEIRDRYNRMARYPMMIISKYFDSIQDYINLEKTCKEYRGIIEQFHFNPITFNNNKERDLFKNIETYYVYPKETPKIGKTEINRLARDKRIKKLVIDNEKKISKVDKDPKIEYRHLSDKFRLKLDPDVNILKGLDDKLKEEDVKHIVVPAQITKLGDNCFGAVTESLIRAVNSDKLTNKIESVELPEDLSEIGEECFASCYHLTEIRIPSKVSELKRETFYFCWNLEKVEIPKGVTNLGVGVFSRCSELKGVTLPSGIEDIPQRCFEGCRNLTGISIHDNIKRIGNKAFSYCTFNEIKIPSTVSWIGESVFQQCSNLQEIIIPKDVSRLENYAFDYCRNLSRIVCSSEIEYIGCKCFHECDSLINIQFYGREEFPIGYVEIPEKVTFLGSSCFDSCSNLTEIKILGNIKEMPIEGFNCCYNLRKINIPTSVEDIASGCFRYCNGLSNLFIPANVEYIKDNAFSSCKKNLIVTFSVNSPIKDKYQRNGRMKKMKEQEKVPKNQTRLTFVSRVIPVNQPIGYNYNYSNIVMNPNIRMNVNGRMNPNPNMALDPNFIF